MAAADALEQLGEAGGVRAILISEGEHTSPIARVTENAIAISGLAPRYLNNAVAALRLSSLPAVVWWRGGSVEALDGLANLADRLVLDTRRPGRRLGARRHAVRAHRADRSALDAPDALARGARASLRSVAGAPRRRVDPDA